MADTIKENLSRREEDTVQVFQRPAFVKRACGPDDKRTVIGSWMRIGLVWRSVRDRKTNVSFMLISASGAAADNDAVAVNIAW